MKKLTSLNKFTKLSNKKLKLVTGGRPPKKAEKEPIRFPTGTIGTYVDGINMGHDGSLD